MLKMLHYFIAIPLIVILFSPSTAIGQTLEWQKTVGGTAAEYSSCIVSAHDSGYIICGATQSVDGDVPANHGSYDAWVIKLSNTGHLIWQKTYGGSSFDAGSRIRPTNDGGYVLVGSTSSVDGDITTSHGNSECWVVKLDGNGNIQWQKTYGGSGHDAGLDILQTLEGGYIIGGYTASPNDGDVSGYHGGTGADCWVIKIDDTGALAWQRTYGGTNDEGVHVIKQTLDSGYIFGGFTMSYNGDVTNYHGGTSDGGDAWVVRLNKFGNLKWQKTYGGTFEEEVFDMVVLSTGNYIIGASTRSSNGDVAAPLGNVDGWVFRLNDTGGIVWQKNYATPQSEHLTSMCRTSDDGYAITGWNEGMWLAKLDSVGILEWQASFGGALFDEGWGICLANDGGYIATGSTESVDGDVTGNHGGTRDVWVIKVKEPLGVGTLRDMPGVKIYPNPTTNVLNIDGLETGTVATMYNVWGQVCKSQYLKAGKAQILIGELPPGIYQMQLIDSNGGRKNEQIIKLH